MSSHRWECQLVFDIKWNFTDALKAIQESPYTDKVEYVDEGKAAGKLTFFVKGVEKCRVQVSSGSTVSLYFTKGLLKPSELVILVKALKDVFWDRSGNPDNLIFRKVVPSPAWLREVFYSTDEGKAALQLAEQLKNWLKEDEAEIEKK